MPTAGDGPDIVDLVHADLDARRAKGVQTYNRALKAHNGRSALRDAYEEALDLACYLRQALAEEEADPYGDGKRAEACRLAAVMLELNKRGDSAAEREGWTNAARYLRQLASMVDVVGPITPPTTEYGVTTRSPYDGRAVPGAHAPGCQMLRPVPEGFPFDTFSCSCQDGHADGSPPDPTQRRT